MKYVSAPALSQACHYAKSVANPIEFVRLRRWRRRARGRGRSGLAGLNALCWLCEVRHYGLELIFLRPSLQGGLPISPLRTASASRSPTTVGVTWVAGFPGHLVPRRRIASRTSDPRASQDWLGAHDVLGAHSTEPAGGFVPASRQRRCQIATWTSLEDRNTQARRRRHSWQCQADPGRGLSRHSDPLSPEAEVPISRSPSAASKSAGAGIGSRTWGLARFSGQAPVVAWRWTPASREALPGAVLGMKSARL